MINIKSITSVIILVSIMTYAIACLLPAYTELLEPYSIACYRDSSGLWCLFWGLITVAPITIYGPFNPDDNWVLIWYANVFYMIAIFRLLHNKYNNFRTLIYAFFAVSVSVIFSYVNPHYIVKDSDYEIAYLKPGYFLWVLSFTILLGAAVWKQAIEFNSKKNKTMTFLLSCLSTIFIVVSLGICYIHVFHNRTNTILLDQKKQCLITDNYCSRIVIYDAITENTDTLHRAPNVKRKTEVKISELGEYFYTTNIPKKHDEVVSLNNNHDYIITNITFPDKQFMSIHLYVNKNGHATIASTE